MNPHRGPSKAEPNRPAVDDARILGSSFTNAKAGRSKMFIAIALAGDKLGGFGESAKWSERRLVPIG